MVKRRSDSWDANLSEKERLGAFMWCRNFGYAKARVLIKDQLEMKAPSMAALSSFYEFMTSQVAKHDLQKAIVDSNLIRDKAKKLGDVQDAVCDGLQQLALDAIVSRDPDKVKLFADLALDARLSQQRDQAIDIKLRRLQILEAKVEKVKESLTASKKKQGLSPKALQEIERQLKMLS